MNIEQTLYPVSAQVISIVVLSKSTKNKKTTYILSIAFAGFSTVMQLVDGKTARKKILKTPKKLPTIMKDRSIWTIM